MKIVICTGGFDPCHSGHVAYLKAAAKIGDALVVGINSDEWLRRKKGQAFMPASERRIILEAMSFVDQVIEFDDSDNTAKGAILKAREMFPGARLVFANGGDRTAENIPEMSIEDDHLQFVFGIGGENKANSSSWILSEWKAPKTERAWGYYRVLHEEPGVKVKELVVDPGKRLSMQKHKNRCEYWLVTGGEAHLNRIGVTGREGFEILDKFDSADIAAEEWHQLCNETDHPLKIIEIQYGHYCDEADIERKPE